MLLLRVFVCAGLVAVVTCASASAGVLPGDSSLIGDLMYSEGYTLLTESRPDATHGTPNDEVDPYYNVETTYHGLPSVQWRRSNAFSFHQGGVNTYLYTTAQNASNAGALSGMAQTGGGTWTLPNALGLDNVIVQTDAIRTPDSAVQISALPSGDGVWDNYSWSTGGLTVDFNWNGGINLIKGYDPVDPGNSIWADSGLNSGIANPWPLGPDPPANPDAIWHNVAVNFNKPANSLGIYVDEVLLGTLDLTTFAGGIYQDYSMEALGIGSRGLGWADNTQIGSPVPEPSTVGLLLTGLLGLLACAWRKRK